MFPSVFSHLKPMDCVYSFSGGSPFLLPRVFSLGVYFLIRFLKTRNLSFINKFVKLNWLAERGHFRISTSSNQTELNHTTPKQTHPYQNGSKRLKLISKWLKLISNSKWLKLISNSSQKFKMAQNGSNSSQNFDFLTQKFKMAVFARFHFLKSKNPISGHN